MSLRFQIKERVWHPLYDACIDRAYRSSIRRTELAVRKLPREICVETPDQTLHRASTLTLISRSGRTTSYRVLLRPRPISWRPIRGPLLSGYVAFEDEAAVYTTQLLPFAFDGQTCEIPLTGVDPHIPPLRIDLANGETIDRVLMPGPTPARDAPNPFLDIVEDLFSAVDRSSKDQLRNLRHRIAARVHPDIGPETEALLRGAAMAEANSRIDRLLGNTR